MAVSRYGGIAGRILYGALFVLVVPALLVAFTARVDLDVSIPPSPGPGAALLAAGAVVLVWGMLDIVRRGEGLPMNAYPPKRLVVGGIYAVVPHPIYTGFVAMCLGVSLYAGSAVGALVTTPLVALSAAALVLGYERPYLLRTFGAAPRPVLGAANLLGPLVRLLRLDRAWDGVLAVNERLANSWNATRVGPARVINHAVFAGLAGGVGAAIVVLMAGSERIGAVATLMIAGVVGAALIGQLLVGASAGLGRPFGYFGGLLGIAAAGLLLYPFEPAMLLVLSSFAFAGPWTQAIGRLRCIVQGCCHGAPAGSDPGVVVCNEHSRVVLAGLGGQRIHPTQLYSILGNAATAVVLTALWASGAPLAFIGGTYLVLAGMVRFVEEGYRGEPLTKVVAGLHSYQWFAVAMLAAGMVMMTTGSPAAPPPQLASVPSAIGIGLVFFLVCGFAMGVDFPESKRRFSRLSG